MSVVLETHVDCGKYSNEFNSVTQQEQSMRYVQNLLSQTPTLHL